MSPNSRGFSVFSLSSLESILSLRRERRPFSLVVAACVLLGLVATIVLGPGASVTQGTLDLVDIGRVAEKDVVSDRKINYVDEKATRLRVEAEERLVLPIFEVLRYPA